MNEADTRAEHIDPALRAAGWGVVEGSRVMREYRITEGRLQGAGQRGKPEIADYVLVYRNHKLAVIEAKRRDAAHTEGLAQAKSYAGKVQARFAYATNGLRIYGVDMQSGAEADVAVYPSPQELWNLTYPSPASTGSSTGAAMSAEEVAAAELVEAWRERFAAVPFEDKGGLWGSRYYQDSAVNNALEAIADNKQRILLTLATGTGKTFIAFQLAWKLFHARWNLKRDAVRTPRILFLADRNILADQAYNSFSAFPEDALVRIAPDDIRKKGRVPKNGSVFFTIFQTFASTGSATGASTGSATGASTGSATAGSNSSAVGESSTGSPTGASKSVGELVEPHEIKDAYGYMYILECADGSFYTGSTVDLRLRLEQHQNGEGAKHTKNNAPVKLVYYETYDRIDEAFAREKQVQGWSRAKKIALINGNVDLLLKLSKNGATPGVSTGSLTAPESKPVPESSAGSLTAPESKPVPESSAGSLTAPESKPVPESSAGSLTAPESKPVPELVEGYFGEYPPDFFDFIVIDECHRGGANDESNWRGILEYFAPAVQLGLTATPKRKDNVNTYEYFGEPVYVYSLKEGINDGFLTPFRVKQFATTLDEYRYTSDDNLIEGEIEAGKLYEEKDFNRIIEIEARERYRVKLFMDSINQREKTLVFCANQAHALAVRDLINQMKSASTDPNYCVRVTANDGERGEQFLRDFQDNEKSIPTILTTSQKLSTGVDARNVRNIVLMRTINSMIEFKQIIGRGTRLYDGKDYFTIYDFVKAHKLFNDPEWDGEPIEVSAGGDKTGPPKQPPEVREPRPEYEAKKKVRVKLRDGKERTIQHISVTTFWGPDGKPVSATEFLTLLFGQLPEFFRDEDELRALWSLPDTRKKLLEGLAEKGFGRDQLCEMQKIIDAENSDLFDVLAHVAFAMQPISREERAGVAHKEVHERFGDKQQAFLDFVLAHYVQEGVEELEQEKLTKLLRLRYHDSIPDAVTDLGGDIDAIRNLFAGFQRYLYQGAAASN